MVSCEASEWRVRTPRFEVVALNEEHYEGEELIVSVDDAEEVSRVALGENLARGHGSK